MGIERAHSVRAAGFKDLVTLADVVDKELQQIAEGGATAELRADTVRPPDNEGRLYEMRLLVDVDGVEGVKDAKYLLVKFGNGWYKTVALTKVR